MASKKTKFPKDEYLKAKEIRELHAALSLQLETLFNQSRDVIQEFTDVRQSDADTLDLAVNESNRDMSLRMADRERRLMNKIRHALHRIQEGEYGACESCGAPITHQRLLARPVATCCIDCKTQFEHLEGRKRVF